MEYNALSIYDRKIGIKCNTREECDVVINEYAKHGIFIILPSSITNGAYLYPHTNGYNYLTDESHGYNIGKGIEIISFKQFIVNNPEKPKNTILKGYKGFSFDMVCNNFQFKKGEIFTHSLPIKLCAKGFHFCTELKDVFTHYPNRNGNVFHEIELFEDSEVKQDTNKCVTNKLRVGKRLTNEEIENICGVNHEEKLFLLLKELYIPIQVKNKHIYLGGSAALMVMGLLPYRKCKDLDIVSPFYQNVPEIVNNAFNSLGLKHGT